MKLPVRQTSDGSAPLWYDADGEYLSYEDITEILNAVISAESIKAASLIYEDCRARGQSSEEAMQKAVVRLSGIKT